MAKLLSGADLAGYIKQRHFETVRGLDHPPVLAIVAAGGDEAAVAYAKVKQRYADDIGAVARIVRPEPTSAVLAEAVAAQSQNSDIDGVIVQLPLPATCDEAAVIAAIDPAKDVDGLTGRGPYDPATPIGILWLLAGYNIDYKDQTVAVVGQGRLVGAPLSRMLEDSGAHVIRCDEHTQDLAAHTLQADVVISAVGQPGLIKPDMVKPGAVVVDAGTSRQAGQLVGDADPSLFDRDDISITPTPGGVGPMTVAALFDNLLRAAQTR